MASDIHYLIQQLYQMIDDAKNVIMAPDKCIIVREEALEILDEIKGQLPSELKKAQELIRTRDEFVDKVKKEAESIRRQAELDAKTIVRDSEILRVARDRANEMIHRAEERAKSITNVTNEYADDALRRAIDALQAAQDELSESRARFRSVSADQVQKQRAKIEDVVNDTKE